jgi:hypothetical protein
MPVDRSHPTPTRGAFGSGFPPVWILRRDTRPAARIVPRGTTPPTFLRTLRLPSVLSSHRARPTQCRINRVEELGVRIDAGELRRFTQGVEKRRDFGAAERLRAVVILPADHRSAQCPLGGVVVERNGAGRRETASGQPSAPACTARPSQTHCAVTRPAPWPTP